MIEKYWMCNWCGEKKEARPPTTNATCEKCQRGKFRCIMRCNCQKLFHPNSKSLQFCSRKCAYKYRRTHEQRGIPKPYLWRARIGACIKCGKEFRAVKDFKNRKQKYCSKACWATRSGRPRWKSKRLTLASLAQIRKWRKTIFNRDRGRCVQCGSDYRLEADHILPVSQRPDLILNVDNGRTLCHECHKQTDTYGANLK